MKLLSSTELNEVHGGWRKVIVEVGKAIRDSAAYEGAKAIGKKAIDAQNKRAKEWKKGKTLTRRGYR
jgi:hypothetical protein